MYRRRKSAAGDFSESADGSPERAACWQRAICLVMMTDGVLDALEDDCEERMRDMIETLEEQNPQEIAEKILSYAICSCGGRIRDDMTVFVLCLWENA